MSKEESASTLCEYAKIGDLESIRLLTACGCSVNADDYDGRTSLHLATSVGNAPIAQHLIECGANLNQKDRWGVCYHAARLQPAGPWLVRR